MSKRDCMAWAMEADLPAAQKLVLVGLAWICDDSGVTFKAQRKLAERFGKDDRWIRGHLAALAESGFLTRYQRHRQDGGRTSDFIVLAVPRDGEFDWAEYDGVLGWKIDGPGPAHPPGGKSPGGSPGGNPPPPPAETHQAPRRKPAGHGEQVGEPEGSSATPERARAKVELPEGFPDELREHLKLIWISLRDVARSMPNAKEPNPVALAHVVMQRPKHPIVKAARDYAGWAVGNARHKDVVAGYRNWLDRENPLAATEVLPGTEPVIEGHANVRRFPTGGRRSPEEEARKQAQADLLRQAADAMQARPDGGGA